ncbi:ParB/RepB/Spo0J family partition protein [Agrobacterium rosae]|uniref:ParB/RepB/Spo0J family partition protein n=1 Tax=Agrobacterium rosae TaxID=1972867 RepID=UPI002A136B5A|nr:ParB/RepB/Spo0J family partition protein [Agrobacterium rosae]MDX8312966.1 ParB/RepB/Spo0J family partition protein [Agrobacterium rosae]
MAEFIRATIADINMGERRRPVDIEWAQGLGLMMKSEGQITPITIRRTPAANKGKTPFTLVAGAHRITAANYIGWQEIDAVIVDADKADAQLMEIAENLHRLDLKPLDRAMFVIAYRELHEDRHGKIQRGGDRRAKDDNHPLNATGQLLSARVQQELGIGAETYKYAVRIGKNIDPILRQAIRGTSAETDQSQLLKLAKLSREDQIKVAATLAVQPDVKMALAFTKPPALVTPPSQSAILTKLIAAWDEASEETRDSFLEHIGMSGTPDALMADIREEAA